MKEMTRACKSINRAVVAIFVALFLQSDLTAATSATLTSATLTINPMLAITDDPISIVCSTSVADNVGVVYYTLSRNGKDVAVLHIRCADSNLISTSCDLPGCKLSSLHCSSLSVEGLIAQRELLAGTYLCSVQQILTSFRTQDAKSNSVELTVGDKTPQVSVFTVFNDDTSEEILNGTEVAAGSKTTITCETPPARPEPGFVISITGRENRTNMSIGHRVNFLESVPREPLVVYHCEVYNGFGNRQSKQIVISTKYGGIASDVTVPKEAFIQMETELEICSIRNHPSARLVIGELDKEMVQPNYPTFKEELGISYAYVKLSQKAAEVKDAKLVYTCRVGGMDAPVRATVVLIGSNTAMLTAGIVIAAIVAFLLIVAGIAYALKKRSATPNPQAEKARYDRVNQNDAGGQNYGNAVGRKNADSNYEPVCV